MPARRARREHRLRVAAMRMAKDVCCLVIALLLCSGAVKAETPEVLGGFVERDEDEALILGLQAGDKPLHDGIVVYADGDDLLVPLLTLCEALGIPVTGSSAQGHAEGWFRDEGRRFLLDTQRRRLHVDGLARETDWRRIERHEDDLYLPLDTFSDWFGLKITPQLNHARLWLDDARDLPAEQRRVRLARWQQRQRMAPTAFERGAIVESVPHWLDWPTVDLDLAASRESARTALSLTALASGDLLRTEGNVSLAWRRDALGNDVADARLRLQRSPRGPGTLGWSGGDVVSPAMPLLLAPREGIGGLIGTWNEDAGNDAFVTELRGEALNGWDVELYRSDELLALRTVERDNRYVFEAVPLQSGLNVFRIVLYGPQGQRREHRRQLTVGASLLRPGERRWRAFALLPGRRLFSGLDTGSPEADAHEDGVAFGAGYQWALGSRAATSVEGLSATRSDGVRHLYASARLQGGLGGWWMEGQWLAEREGGRALRVAAQRNAERSDLGMAYERFDDFVSPEIETDGSGERPRDRLRLRWSGRLGARTPVSLEAERQRALVPGGEDHARGALRMRLSQRWHAANFTVSTELDRDSARAPGAAAGLLLNYRRAPFDLNAQLTREFAPHAGLRQGDLTVHWALNDRLRLRAQFSRTPAARARDRIDLGLAWSTKRWSLQLGVMSSDDGTRRLSVGFSTSLQHGPDGWQADARAAAATGNAEARVFLDRNADGRFDAGDRPLGDVAIRASTDGRTVRTGPDGRALLARLPAGTLATLRLQPESLDNPFWLPTSPTVSLRPHPGARVSIDFPVVPTTEIDGTAFIVTPEGRKPAANVLLQLRDPQGAVVREVRSAFDGAYLIDRLPPGDYTLAVSPEQIERLRLRPTPSRRVVLGDGHDVTTLDWKLIPVEASGKGDE